MNEWGRFNPEYYENPTMAIDGQNPAITGVRINRKWSHYGSLENSKYVKHLKLDLTHRPFIGWDKVRSFCSKLAVNKSLVSIILVLKRRNEHEANEVLNDLLPFLRNNENLKSVIFGGFLPANASVAIRSCSSLESIGFVDIKANNIENFEAAVEVIHRKPNLHHVTFKKCSLSSRASRMIESALADENCSIKSLDLTQVTADLACMLCIKNGLAQNTSIKCLREIIPPLTIAVPLLVPVQVNTMEKLDIRGCRIDGPVLAQVLQQMPMLKSLCLTGSRRRSDLSDVFATVFNGVILLQELNVAGVIRDNESLQELALHLATNTHLKVLDLRCCRCSYSDFGWNTFFTNICTSRLEKLYLADTIQNDFAMAALSSRLSLFQSLRVLSVSSRFLSGADHWNEDPIITSVGWDSFATELRSHATIEELDIGCSVRRFDRNLNYSLTNALQVNQSLKRFRLAVLGISQLQKLFTRRARYQIHASRTDACR
jgi:hypothetical protein